jgi:drug/metabolite transporter (DMT)-like permease
MWIGYTAAIGAAMSYGVAQTVGKLITTEYAPPLVGTGFALIFGLLYVSIIFHRQIPTDIRTAPRLGFFWFSVSGVFSASGVALMYFALNSAPLVVVSPVFAINPLVTLILASIFLKRLERITKRMVFGTLLVILGIVVITISRYMT